MKPEISRKEFLKFSSLFFAAAATKYVLEPGKPFQGGGGKNVLFLVFDAWSAKNVSLYGYERETTPNLARLADRATVYHKHFAGANWTYPGTASLLTGALPYAHRGFIAPVVEPFDRINFFSLFEDYYRLAYSHNPMAEAVFSNFISSINRHIPRQEWFLQKRQIVSTLFSRDYDTASLSYVQAMKRQGVGYSYSLFLAEINRYFYEKTLEVYREDYPYGPPEIEKGNFFLLEDAVEAITAETPKLPTPFLAYYHLLPPHAIYKPRRDFLFKFVRDGYQPVIKPKHFLGDNQSLDASSFRRVYDEYILNVDAEIGRLFGLLEESGVLENTWVILTSDHGEMFERGIVGHRAPVFHQPVIRVPLLIFEPGQGERRDVYQPTSAADVLPTLLHLNGRPVPEILEGRVLPPFGSDLAEDRPIYAMDARHRVPKDPLKKFTIMLVRWPHKLMYYKSHLRMEEGQEIFEMYDLENDPEELVDIYSPQSATAQSMKAEVLAKLREADRPYL